MLLMKIKTFSKIPQNYLQSRVAFFSIVFQLQAILISSLLFQQKAFVEKEQLDPHGFHRLAPDEKFLKRKTFSLKLFECIETSYCSMKICCPTAVSIKLNNNYFNFSSRLDLFYSSVDHRTLSSSLFHLKTTIFSLSLNVARKVK